MKVKFTKLAALLLAGVALFATGCTDYEVDIQKVDKKVDDLTSGKVATLESQVAELQATVATLEKAADHKADIDKLNKAISDLQTALNGEISGLKDRVKAIEDADFQKQINTLTEKYQELENNKASKDELAKVEADLRLLISGEIGKLDTRLQAAEKTLDDLTKEGGIIDQIKDRIKAIEDELPTIRQNIIDLQNGKLDKTEFDTYYKAAYEKYTKATIDSMQEAIDALTALTAGFPEDKTIKEYIDEADQTLKDDYTAKYLSVVAKAFGTEEKMNEMKGTLLGRLEACEALLAGDWGDKTVKEYIDGEVKNLQDQIDVIEEKVLDLQVRVGTLEASMDKVLAALEFCAKEDEDGNVYYDLQGYIDNADQALQDQIDEIWEWVDEYLIPTLNEIFADIYDQLDLLNERVIEALSRIQSVQYVPDYDDLKITTNMSYVYQVEADGRVPGETETEEIPVLFVDQPTQVTYQFLPAQYAQDIADGVEDFITDPSFMRYLVYYFYGIGDEESDDPFTREELKELGITGILPFFDVRPVNTRDDDAPEAPQPAFIITSVDKVDTTTGEITFTVQPVNVASAQYAANGLKPMYDIGLTDAFGHHIRGWDPEAPFWDPTGYFRAEDVLDESKTLTVPVWSLNDLRAYQDRAAFAAQLRLYAFQDFDENPYYGYDDEELEYIDYENELASPYNVLYPKVSEIKILPEPYKKETNGNVRPFLEDEVYQTLPYSALRKDGDNAIGEKPEQSPKGYRIILDQAVPVVVIDDSEPMSLEAAEKAGYHVPPITTDFVEFTYVDKNDVDLPEDRQANFVETNKVYAEIEMNAEKSASSRKKEVGDIITGAYKFTSVLGSWPFEGYVEITKPQGKVEADAKIVWTWDNDAIVDHNLFYENEQEQDEAGETPVIYKRVALPINLNADQMAALETNLGLTLENFSHLTPNTLKITTTDETGAEVEVTDLQITNVAIKDGKLLADIANFAWDKVYKIVAVYNGLGADNKPLLDADGQAVDFPAEIELTVTLTTVDRNREKVVLGPYEHTFVVNGEEFVDGYYHWTSDALHRDVFKAFDADGVINVEDVVDFAFDADQEGFNAGELEGKLRMADPSGTAAGYIDFNRTDIVLNTLSTLTPEVLAGELFNSGKRSEENPNLWIGNPVTRNVTTYIGEEVELTVVFNYEVPSYNFLHLRFYTFNPDKEVANLITKLDFDDNDGTVKWWSQVYPSYFTDPAPSQLARDARVSNRYALADYDVAYINLAELAFNVVDDKDEIIEDADLAKLGLTAKFIYTDDEQGVKPLPTVDKLTDPKFDVYSDLWVGPTVFYYRTNEKKFIPALGELTVTVGTPGQGGYAFPVATRFEFPKASVKVPEEILDYSTFAMVRWTPFQAPEAKDYEIVLDENKIYREPLFKGMTLKDNRPQGVSFYVIKEGEWVVGDAAADAAAGSTKNGYITGIVSKDAYHITTDFEYDTTGIPNELKKLLKIEVVEGVPYVVYDYTSEVQFHGVVTIPVTVTLENPWQEDIVFDYNVIIKGIGD